MCAANGVGDIPAMKKALIVTYYWPPAGGPGVQRVAKFCRYLGESGWQPVVLTVKNGNYRTRDSSLLHDVATVNPVYRARTLEPHAAFNLLLRCLARRRSRSVDSPGKVRGSEGLAWRLGELIRLNLFIPDSRVGWYPAAVRLAVRVMQGEQPSVIFSSAPPYTPHLIAKAIKRRFHVPWVADFRDPWVESHTYNTMPRLPAVVAVNRLLEKRTLTTADRVLCTNEGLKDILSGKLTQDMAGKFSVITNGYDRADVRPSGTEGGSFRVSYFGTVYGGGFPVALFRVFADLVRSGGLPADTTLRIVGHVDPAVARVLERTIPPENLDVRGYVNHGEYLELLAMPQVLVLVINDFPLNHATVPAKLFEYMASGNPILGLGPVQGDAANLLRQAKAGDFLEGGDADGIKRFLGESYRSWRKRGFQGEHRQLAAFERSALTRDLAGLFDSLVAEKGRT